MSDKTLYIYSVDLATNVGHKIQNPISASIVQVLERSSMTLNEGAVERTVFANSAYERGIGSGIIVTFDDIVQHTDWAGYGLYFLLRPSGGGIFARPAAPAYYLRWRFEQGSKIRYLYMIGLESDWADGDLWASASDPDGKYFLLVGPRNPADTLNKGAGYMLTRAGIKVTVSAGSWVEHGFVHPDEPWPYRTIAIDDSAYFPEEII